MAHYNFRKDLKEGVKGEEFIVTYLETRGLTYLHSNNDNKYDIKMNKNGIDITYEIKTDFYCKPNQDRGNLFVEFECRKKPSGIEVTEAEWFVTFFPYLREIWFIEPSKLKSLIETENFRITSQSGDAGSNTRGHLIPRNKYKEYFNVRKL